MQHHNSVFHEVLKEVPWAVFDRLVAAHGADRRVRQLTTKSQFIALLYGQLEGAASLREIEAGLESHHSRLYHLGASAPRRSTLADANKLRPCAVFAELFAVMAARAHRPPRRVIEELPVKPGGAILSDRIGFLPQRQGSGRRNPMADAVREVQVKTDSGKVLRLLSNDLDAAANAIAELYKRRWRSSCSSA